VKLAIKAHKTAGEFSAFCIGDESSWDFYYFSTHTVSSGTDPTPNRGVERKHAKDFSGGF